MIAELISLQEIHETLRLLEFFKVLERMGMVQFRGEVFISVMSPVNRDFSILSSCSHFCHRKSHQNPSLYTYVASDPTDI